MLRPHGSGLRPEPSHSTSTKGGAYYQPQGRTASPQLGIDPRQLTMGVSVLADIIPPNQKKGQLEVVSTLTQPTAHSSSAPLPPNKGRSSQAKKVKPWRDRLRRLPGKSAAEKPLG
jgi:hypothetical protein